VDNRYLDPESGRRYDMKDSAAVTDAQFYGGLPLWQLVQRHGWRSASYFWVGSEAPIAGSHPDYWVPYNSRVDNRERIREVLRWLSLPEPERPVLLTLYFSLVDSAGHDSGPDGEATARSVREADRLLAELRAGLAELDTPVNLLVMSDHGMLAVDEKPETVLDLTQRLPLDGFGARVSMSSTQAMFYVDPDQDEAVLLEQLRAALPELRLWRREETPEHWHYRSHPHIGDIIAVAPPGLTLAVRPWKGDGDAKRGVHGYDPEVVPEVHGIFYAAGPSIRAGLTLPALHNVDIYPFVTALLGIETPAEVDGSAEALAPALR